MKDGKISKVAYGLNVESAVTVIDGKNRFAFPGAVDAHMHAGIYSHLKEDAISESRAAAMGGVTSSLNYMRTGQYYLNKSGPYDKFFPEVLKISDGRFHVDYAYHLAPMMGSHIDEIEPLIDEYGVTSFKIFMFYGSHGLHGKSDDQSDFLMIGLMTDTISPILSLPCAVSGGRWTATRTSKTTSASAFTAKPLRL